MKKSIAIILALCILCSLFFSGCGCKHEWAEANCTEPKTCKLCGETEGEAAGHVKGEWETGEEATIFESGTRVKKCTVCGQTLTTERFELTTYIAEGSFVFSPEEISQKLEGLVEGLGSDIKLTESTFEGAYALEADFGGGEAVFIFADEDSAVMPQDKAEKGLNEIALIFSAQTALDCSEAVAEAVILYFLALDPELSLDEAGTMCTTLFNGIAYNSNKISVLPKNGISHCLSLDDDSNFILVTSVKAE